LEAAVVRKIHSHCNNPNDPKATSPNLTMMTDADVGDWAPTSWRSKRAAQVCLSSLLCLGKNSFDRPSNIRTGLTWQSPVPTMKTSPFTYLPSHPQSPGKNQCPAPPRHAIRGTRVQTPSLLAVCVGVNLTQAANRKTLIFLCHRSNDFGIS
jgi:hypothetical protein